MFDDRDAPLYIDFGGWGKASISAFLVVTNVVFNICLRNGIRVRREDGPMPACNLMCLLVSASKSVGGETKRLTKDIRERVLLEEGSLM